jgi:hypothetical protein
VRSRERSAVEVGEPPEVLMLMNAGTEREMASNETEVERGWPLGGQTGLFAGRVIISQEAFEEGWM